MTVTDLIRQIEEKIASTARALALGNCGSWDQYLAQVARIRAFQEVIDLTRPERKTSEGTQDINNQ